MLNAVVMSLEKFIARNNPEIIWIIKHIPKRDPIFHIYEMFDGVGRLISGLRNFLVFISYWYSFIGAFEDIIIIIIIIKVSRRYIIIMIIQFVDGRENMGNILFKVIVKKLL